MCCRWVLALRESLQAGHQLLGLEQAPLPATSLLRPYLAALCRAEAWLGAVRQL